MASSQDPGPWFWTSPALGLNGPLLDLNSGLVWLYQVLDLNGPDGQASNDNCYHLGYIPQAMGKVNGVG